MNSRSPDPPDFPATAKNTGNLSDSAALCESLSRTRPIIATIAASLLTVLAGFSVAGTFFSLRSYTVKGVTPQRLSGVPLKFFLISSLILSGMAIAPASAQTTDNPEIAACKATGILALKEKSPAVRDLILDMDTMVVSKAATEIEGIPIRTVIMGDVYLEKKVTGKAQHFLCLIGEKGKVLLTFFVAP